MDTKILGWAALSLLAMIIILYFLGLLIPDQLQTAPNQRIPQSNGTLTTYEVHTNPATQNEGAPSKTTDKYDDKLLAYLDKQQEARDKTFHR